MTQSFTVYPALDVLDGRAVRLRQGRREDVTIEGGDPVAAAERFASAGADWLHVVDLDAAFGGSPDLGLVERIAAVGVPLQVGGGFRTIDLIDGALGAGATRVVVGTAAGRDGFLRAAVERFGDAVAVAVDARDGAVAVNGWTSAGALTPRQLADRCAGHGVARLVVTATRRDGTLSGPDVALVEEVLAAGLPVIAAGGISSLDDLRALRNLGCEGAVVGSALWLGGLDLGDAVSLRA